MKKLNILAIVPVLSLLMIGCSSPMALQSSEYDDMYYASSDKTEFVYPGAETYSQSGQTSTEGAAGSTGTDNYQGDEYYDGRTYDAQAYDTRDNWYRPNYSFVDPYWGTAYAAGFYPRYSSFRYGSAFYDPFYDPFFDPFYSPFYSPWGPSFNRFSISVGYGMGWGHPMGMYGMGMGAFHRPFYGGMWGPYGSYYNGFNSGFYQGYYAGSLIDGPGQVRRVQYGPRTDRSTTGAVRSTTSRPSRETLSATGQQRQMVTPGAQNVRPSIQSRPAAPARTNAVTGQQPSRVNQQQQQQQVQQNPARQQRVRETTPARQPQQRPTYERSTPTPSYERSTPSYERSMPAQSSPSRPSNSGGGRPSRGGF